jgi:homoserine O-acetyltransferase
VAAQRLLLERLGVKQLVAVVGPSYGGFQAFTWGVEHPDFVRGIAPVTTAPTVGASIDVDGLRARLAAVPGWNDGYYYPEDPTAPLPVAMVDAMTAIREATLRRYGADAMLADNYDDSLDRIAALHAMAREWAQSFDPHSLLVLGTAANELDAMPRLSRIRARVLYVLSSSDALFPPSLADVVMPALHAAGVDAIYEEIDSPYGHLAPGIDAAQWNDALSEFLDELA